MDATPLRSAYATFLHAAEAVAGSPAELLPPPGEWSAAQLLAHVQAVDAGVLAAACSIAAGGGAAAFDNRSSLQTDVLARITGRAGGQEQLRRRIQVQGRALCDIAEDLGDDELDEVVQAHLTSAGKVLLDGPLSLRDLIGGLAADHLPRHADQLLSLLPPA